MLFLIGRFGMEGGQYQAVEYRGDAIASSRCKERMTLCNMTAELGGQVGLIASDSVTREFLKTEIEIWDSGRRRSAGSAHHRFNAGSCRPRSRRLIVLPIPRPFTEFRDVKPDLAYIGA